jgi:hypothetical protein
MSNSTHGNSWLKLYHKFLEWEWYQDINTSRLFVHILLKTNYKDKKWRGEIIKRGTFITSLENLSKETGLSVQQVRTSLNKLKSTHEITYLGTREYSKITVNNYNAYQPINTPNNKQSTDHQHTDNTPLTTTIERYKDRKIEYIYKKGKETATLSHKEDLNTIVGTYNQRFNKNLTSTKGFEKNYIYWKDIHSTKKILKAVENASKDKFWKDKMTLTILFRKKNSNGEAVDYIEDLSSRSPHWEGSIAIV